MEQTLISHYDNLAPTLYPNLISSKHPKGQKSKHAFGKTPFLN